MEQGGVAEVCGLVPSSIEIYDGYLCEGRLFSREVQSALQLHRCDETSGGFFKYSDKGRLLCLTTIERSSRYSPFWVNGALEYPILAGQIEQQQQEARLQDHAHNFRRPCVLTHDLVVLIDRKDLLIRL